MFNARPIRPLVILALCVIAAGCALTLNTASATTTSAVSTITNPLKFTENFNSGRMAGWTVTDEGTISAPSNWHVVSGQLKQTSNIYSGKPGTTDIGKPGTTLTTGNAAWKNYNFTTLVRAFDNDDIGVVFRYTDKNNYYRFSMNKETGYERLVKKVAGTYTVLAQNKVGYNTDTRYKLNAVAVGDHLQILVDDAMVFDVHDSSLTRGKFGLYTWGSDNTTFDTISAQVQDDDYFTVAVVPDTQYESESYASMLAAQMNYLTTKRTDMNLAMVLQEGDVINVAVQSQQWQTATKYFSYLNGATPYVVAAGNHDLFQYTEPNPTTINPTRFNAFMAGLGGKSITGTMRPNDYRDTYYLFSAGGVDMMVLNLEFGSDDSVLNWASSIVDQYPDRHVLLLTHDYLGEKNNLRGTLSTDRNLPHNYIASLNNGVDVWNKFVRKHPNVQFTFNGHVITPVSATENYSVGRLVGTNDAGKPVYQTLTNYQTLANAGRGYLRLFKFYPAQSKVVVTTYSPYYNTSLSDPLNSFTYSGVDLN